MKSHTRQSKRKASRRGEAVFFSEDGFSGGYEFLRGPVDEHGNRVTRTKESHPYSYDGFILWRNGPNEEANGTVYSDRLWQWDYAKSDRLWKEHCEGHRWDNVPDSKLTAFLRAWQERPDLKIIFLMEYCNQASGYPCWRVDYHLTPTKP